MNRIMTLLLGSIVLTAACAAPPAQKTVLLEVPDDPTVSLALWFKVGSQDDPPGKEGLARLTAQMLSDASTTANRYEAILEKLYPLASSYRASVDREMIVLSGRTHRDNLDDYLGLYEDAFLRPAFLTEDFERLKTDALNQIENSLRYSSDEELGKAALYSFVFEGTRYAHPMVGTVEGLRSITLDDVRAFYQAKFTRDRAVVALGGGVNPALVARLEQARDQLPAAPERRPAVDVPAAPSIERRQLLLVDKPNADASISFGFPIDVLRGEREFYALWVANSWLGEHRNSSSHLYKVIREVRGLNYGDYSYIESFPNGGRRSMPPTHVGRHQQIFEVWIRTLPNTQAHFALRAAVRELDRLIADGMSEEDFELTRSFLKKYILHFADTTRTRLGYAVDDAFYGIDGEGHLARFGQVLDELTRDEVNAAIRKHLQTERMKIAIVTGDATGLREALVTDTPSPMQYESQKPASVLEEDKEIAAYPLNIEASRVRTIPVAEFLQR